MKPEIVKQYVDTGKVRFVWHDFAWIGDESRLSAQGARCAGRQGRFWEYHDHLYNNQRGENRGQFAAANLKAFAAEVKLDTAAFATCLDAAAEVPALQEELRAWRAAGINSTPTLMVNGQRVGSSRQAVADAIEAELKKLGR